MKKLFSVLCAVCMLASAISLCAFADSDPAPAPTDPTEASKWDGTIPEANKDYAFAGEGTKKSPWLIQSAAELAQLAANARLDSKDTTYGGKFFKLTCDIDMDNHPWLGIGGAKLGSDGLGENGKGLTYFAGNFDGDYHKIYNFTLATTYKTSEGAEKTVHQQGLFGYILGARITNLGIESGNVVLENTNRSGVLVGVARCGFLIENCYNKANLTLTTNGKSAVASLLVGMGVDPWTSDKANTESMTNGICKEKQIINCYNTGNLTVTLNQTDPAGNYRLGGILGQYVGGSPELDGVYNFGDVTVVSNSVAPDNNNHCIGGISGVFLDGAYVVNTYFKGKYSVTLNVAVEEAKTRFGYLFGRVSSKVTFDMDSAGVNVGYQILEGSTEGVKAVAEPAPSEDPEVKLWYAAMENLVLPLAENSTFLTAPKKADDKPTQTTEKPTQPETPTQPTPTSPSQSDSDETPTQPKPNGDATTETPQSGEKKGCQSSLGAMTVALIGLSALGIGLIAGRKKHD